MWKPTLTLFLFLYSGGSDGSCSDKKKGLITIYGREMWYPMRELVSLRAWRCSWIKGVILSIEDEITNIKVGVEGYHVDGRQTWNLKALFGVWRGRRMKNFEKKIKKNKGKYLTYF